MYGTFYASDLRTEQKGHQRFLADFLPFTGALDAGFRGGAGFLTGGFPLTGSFAV